MEKYFSKVPKPNVNVDPPPPLPPPPHDNVPNVDKASGKRPRIEVDVSDDDIIGDPRMRPPLENYSSQKQDAMRRRYLAKGPYQPIRHNFPQITFGKSSRRFIGDWFKSYEWLEYSVSKDRAYCLWCYLFAHTLGTKVNKYGSKTWTEIGFNDWKDATSSFRRYEGLPDSCHNKCRVMVNEFQKQKGNIDNLLAFKTVAMEEEYRIRLTMVVNVVRLLLEEGLPFRGHDESKSSMHQGHFLGVLRWYCRNNKEFSKLQDIGALAKKMVEVGYNKHFRLVYRLIELVLVLLIGIASVERCFSAMNNVKTDLRNRMEDEFLTNCRLCFIEKEIFVPIETKTTVQCFQKLATRRNNLTPISIKKK